MAADKDTSTNITAITEDFDDDGGFKCPSSIAELGGVVSAMPQCDMRFPHKAFHILTLSDKSSPHVACWNVGGDAIVIKDKAQLEKEYLSISFESFVRQLHIYGFRKVNILRGGGNNGSCNNNVDDHSRRSSNNRNELIFRHEHFQRDRPDILSKIQPIKKDEKDNNAKHSKQKELTRHTENSVSLDPKPTAEASKPSSVDNVTDASAALHEKLDRMERKVGSLFAKIDLLNGKFDKMLSIALNTNSGARVSDSSLEDTKLVHKRPRQKNCRFKSKGTTTVEQQQIKFVGTVFPPVPSSKDVINYTSNLALLQPIHLEYQQSLQQLQQQHESCYLNPSAFSVSCNKTVFCNPPSGQPHQYGEIFEGEIENDTYGFINDCEQDSEFNPSFEQKNSTNFTSQL